MLKNLSGPRSLAVIAVLAGIVGYAAATISNQGPGAAVSSAPPADADAGSAELLARVALLEEQLRVEQTRHAELRADVEWMATRVEAAAGGVETLLEGASTGAPPAPEAERVAVGPDARAPHSPLDEPRRETGEDVLLEAGFDPGDVDAYRARVADLEMERLYLADRAAREGWMGSDRFRDENEAISDELAGTREEYGDDLYDWALYSAGRPNRVRVASVIDGSPAASAGIATGDIIFSYGDARVMSTNDLQQSTREGRAGSTARVELLRGDETVQASIPRGPLGVRLRPTRMKPPPAR